MSRLLSAATVRGLRFKFSGFGFLFGVQSTKNQKPKTLNSKSETLNPMSATSTDTMLKSFLRSKRLVVSFIIISIFTSVAAVAPFYFSRSEKAPDGHTIRHLIATHDLWIHLHMMDQFDKGLRSGVLYPRWAAEINHGYGILSFLYYPPGIFYLSSATHAVVNDWHVSLFIITLLALFGSGLALYKLARTFYGPLASSIAALFYMFLPMHMLDLYWRGGLPQFIGYVFPPLTIYFAFKLVRKGALRYYAAFAFCYGVHILTHFPIALMFSYALVFLAVVWAWKERNWRIAARFGLSMALGQVLSAIYWLPAAIEAKYAYEYTTSLFPYHLSYITLVPVAGAGPAYDFGQTLNYIFAFHALTLIVTILVLRKLSPKSEATDLSSREWSPRSIWMTMAIATTFMTTSYSVYISKLLPKIEVAVPSWRWFALAGMFTCLLIAAAIDKLQQNNAYSSRVIWACRAAIGAVILTSLVLSIQKSVIRPLANETYYPAATAYDVVESSWTPKAATYPQELPDTPLAMSDPPGAAIEISKWKPQQREIFVKADQTTLIRLKTYNFRGWTARLDGQIVPMLSDKDGIQQVEVPPGAHTINATFESTAVHSAAAALSGIGLLAILAMAFAGRGLRLPAYEAAGQAAVDRASSIQPHKSWSATFASIQRHRLAIVALLLIVAIAVFIATRNSDSARPSTGTSRNSNRASSPLISALTVGSDAHLFLEGRDSVMVALDETASNELVTAISNGDKNGLDSLIESGRALNVENNTRVRVLQAATGRIKVRILEGPHIMAEGWVLERWMH